MVSASVTIGGDLEYKKLQDRIYSRAMEGLWLFYAELQGEHSEAAKEMLKLLDESRLNCFLAEKGSRICDFRL